MLQSTRYKLHGTYRTPRFQYGGQVEDMIRGDVIITGLSKARISWPIAKTPGGRARQLVIYGTLARAIEVESNIAVAHWWGVTSQTVTTWRRRLGIVGRPTAGTTRLQQAYAEEPFFKRAQRRALLTANDPVRRAKISASKIGKRRPKHVVEAVRKAHLGTVASDETRRKMSESHKRRGTRPPKAGRPWTPEEDALLDTMPIADVAKATRRTIGAVRCRRQGLGLPDGRIRRNNRA